MQWILCEGSNLENLEQNGKYKLLFSDGTTRIGYYFYYCNPKKYIQDNPSDYFRYCNPEKYFKDIKTGEIINDKVTHFMPTGTFMQTMASIHGRIPIL